MARQRLFEYGPSIGRRGIATIPRITTSFVRQGFGRSGVRRLDNSINAITTKSVLRPKVRKGIRPPGYQAPNYPSPLD